MADAGPIADLTYRGYDGPLDKPSHRWVVCMRQGIRFAFAKRAFWVLTALSGWYYLSLIAFLYVIEQVGISAGRNEISDQFLSRTVWHDQLLNGFTSSHLFFLSILLMLGAGSIANDNRSNALLVYLSKPTSKFDYLFGKWMGIFVPMMVAMALPSLVFLLYGALNFGNYGFLTDDPWMVPKFILMVPCLAAFQTSVILGLSSLFNQGRLAGATYAGLYFLIGFFSQLMAGLAELNQVAPNFASLLNNIRYISPFGVNFGLAKLILGTDGTPYWGLPSGHGPRDLPPVPFIAALALGGAAFCILLSVVRVKAVEVVRS